MIVPLKIWVLELWLLQYIIFMSGTSGEYVRPSSEMKCYYGERGSLTATCVNAVPSFFKNNMYKFDHLDETLRCVNCTLTVIKPNTFDLAGNQIKELDLTNCNIEVLEPRAFMGLIFMQTTKLAHNKIRLVFPGTFTGIKKVTLLDLSNNEISILNEFGFAELQNLNMLLLHHNQIKVIDTRAFSGLSELKNLDLSLNHISKINDSFQNVSKLETLDLSENDINQLSGIEFRPLLKLNVLNLAQNHLKDQFSFNLTDGNMLRALILNNNEINYLWFNFSYLHSLEVLDLNNNNISEIREIPNDAMYNLRILLLSHNNLTKFQTGDFTHLPQLRNLNCSYNSIQSVLINEYFSLPNLQWLDISNNLIEELDYEALVNRALSLRYLDLENNRLPCVLDMEMRLAFSEDNFKYKVGRFPKCVDKPLTKSSMWKNENLENLSFLDQESMKGLDVTILVFMTITVIAIAVLFYLQYLSYKGATLGRITRVTSSVHLISSDSNAEENLENVFN